MHKLYRPQPGFTIVELLIVIVVIAILATISVVAYNGIQNRANDTAVQSDLRNIGQKILEFQATQGALPIGGQFTVMNIRVATNSYGNHYQDLHNAAYCLNSTAGMFAVVAASKSGNVYVFKYGTTKLGVGPLQTHSTTCSNNGQDTPHSSTWFRANGVWQFGMGG